MSSKHGYLLLTDTGTVFTRFIKLFTNKPYNHVSISFDSQLNEVFSFGRKSVGNPFSGGFVIENMQSNLFSRARCAIYTFEITEEQLHDMKQFIQSIEDEKSQYRYNLIGLFGFIINKPIKRTNAYFCSQFVATFLSECHVINFEKSLSLIAPDDLYQLLKCLKIFEGNLCDYMNVSIDDSVKVAYDMIPIN